MVLAIFYGVYKICFSKNSFYSLNRVVLWSIPALTIFLPFIHFQLLPRSKPIILSVPVTTVDSSQIIEAPIAAPSPINIETVILILYVAVFLFLLTRYVVGFLQMKKIIQRSKPEILDNGTVLCLTDREVNPFSFLKYIVISNAEEGRVDDNILLHEKSHIRLKHSIDKIVFEIFYIFFWFNPFAWLLKRELQSLQEFQADANVIQKGINMQQYQILLIRKSVSEKNFALANNFLQCDLHKRIKMMKNKTNSKRKWSYLLAIPAMVICAFILSVPKLNAKTAPVIVDYNTGDSVIITDDSIDITQNPLIITNSRIVSKEEAEKYFQKKLKIAGVVKDEKTKEPIIGATLVIKGTNRGVTTDKKGNFSIEIERGDVLQLMYPDYEVGEIKTNNEMSKFDIFLSREKGESEHPQKLQGRPMSIAYPENQKRPLYVVDGKKQENALSELAAGDIESVSVLKGNSATDLYGEEGKNGVIHITTKNKPKSIDKALVVVDGIVKDDDFDLKTMNADNIKEVNIVKSADGVKRYGEKAKNGVIEITIKK